MENADSKEIKCGDGRIAELLANQRCPVCTSALKWIYVHGHYQCVTCKAVVNDCCSGEKAS